MVSTVRPKARETPRSPIPTSGKAAAITALPQPAKVSQKVPMASAVHLRRSIALAPTASRGAYHGLPRLRGGESNLQVAADHRPALLGDHGDVAVLVDIGPALDEA